MCAVSADKNGDPMIEFRSIDKKYADGTQAVEDFSYTVESHQVVVFVGSSGSGKTTLLRMVNRMIDPTSGSILIDGVDITTSDPVALRRSIGYVMQSGGLLPHRRILDNIATVPILNGVPRKQAYTAAAELLERVGLEQELGRRFPVQLSGGQQQRVGVARALASDPNILLMDEPFAAVDPIVRRELQDELRRLQKELGKTIILVTHDIDEAFSLGDQVVVLRTGGIIAQAGTPAQIMANPADAFVRDFIGSDRTERSLVEQVIDGRRVVVDLNGNPVGVLNS